MNDAKYSQLTKAAEGAVKTLEAIALGEPYHAEHEAAVGAAEALRRHARSGFMRPLEPIDSDTTATLSDLIGWLPAGGTFGADLAALHAEARLTHPALAAAIRGVATTHRVRKVAEVHAARIQKPAAAYAAESVAAFEHLIASTMADTDEAARAFLLACGVAATAQAVRVRHEAHAAATVAAIEADQRQADAAIAGVDADRRAAIAAFFSARRGQTFQVGGRMFDGAAVTAMLRGELARDTDGDSAHDLNVAANPTLDQIEKAMRQRVAHEAAA